MAEKGWGRGRSETRNSKEVNELGHKQKPCLYQVIIISKSKVIPLFL